MTKALFFDIDGTLVSTDTHRIPQSAIDAIDAAQKNGISIFIATGRPPALMDNIGQVQEAGLIDGYVTMNGCYCYVGEEVIYKKCIPERDWKAMGAFCRENNFACTFTGTDVAYAFQENDILKDIFYKQLNARKMESIDYNEIDFDVMQMSPFFDAGTERGIAEQLTGCEFSRWHPGFADVNAAGCTKQEGIEVILKHFGYDAGEIMAFGDGGNDLTMLKMAGIGVAMGNACDIVKKTSDYVTSHIDQDGIANALKHFNLI